MPQHQTAPLFEPAPALALVLNRRAGAQGDEAALRRRLEAAFLAQGVQARVFEAVDGRLDDAAQAAAGSGAAVVVAAGGDGSFNTVANAVARMAPPRPALALLPLGTFNHVARRQGIPLDLDEAVAVAVHGHAVPLAAGEVNGQLFFNNCCFGLYSSLIQAREEHKRRFGRRRIVAIASALWTLLRPHARRAVAVELPGQRRRRLLRSSLVFVAANPLQLEDVDAALARDVAEGALGLLSVREVDAWRLLKFAWGAWREEISAQQEVFALPLREATLHLRARRLPVVLDGELRMLRSPFRLRRREDVLSLRVPAAGEEAAGPRA
jgi:diacylglycerol kinase family enzyme